MKQNALSMMIEEEDELTDSVEEEDAQHFPDDTDSSSR